jgi:hypothetical protein
MLQLSAFWPHQGALQAASLLAACGVAVVIMNAQRNRTQCPNLLHLRPARWGIAAPSKLKRLQSCKIWITAQKKPAGDNTGVRRQNFFSKYTTPHQSFAAALHSSDQQHWQQQSQKRQ